MTNFKDLLVQSKFGDTDAITELFMLYRPLLLKNSILDNRLDEDLYQELCLTFLRCVEKFRI